MRRRNRYDRTITRSEIQAAVKDFLDHGGTIQVLPPTPNILLSTGEVLDLLGEDVEAWSSPIGESLRSMHIVS